jgi:hypothetical protein
MLGIPRRTLTNKVQEYGLAVNGAAARERGPRWTAFHDAKRFAPGADRRRRAAPARRSAWRLEQDQAMDPVHIWVTGDVRASVVTMNGDTASR